MTFERLLSFDEVAEILCVSSRTVYTLVKRGELSALKVGSGNRVDPLDLRRFIEQAKRPGGSAQPEFSTIRVGDTFVSRK